MTSSQNTWTTSTEDEHEENTNKVISLCKIVPSFWSNTTTTGAYECPYIEGHNKQGSRDIHQSCIFKSLFPPPRRLRLQPSSKLYFPYEPGKQVRSAITIKNICKAYVAFKFQTTEPKSCYMRPPVGILAPGETLVAVVFKFVEPPDKNDEKIDRKSRVKFKIMSLKMPGGDQLDYIPDLFEEQKDQVSVEQILRVVFVDADRHSPVLEKLKRQLAEADASINTCRKPQEVASPQILGEGLVIDEWRERRERYLARQEQEQEQEQERGDVTDSI